MALFLVVENNLDQFITRLLGNQRLQIHPDGRGFTQRDHGAGVGMGNAEGQIPGPRMRAARAM